MKKIVLAPAKLNLRLKVEGRRKDGYHLLSMLNVQVGIYDVLELEVRDAPGITVQCSPTGDYALDQALSDPEKNIAAKAAQNFFREFGIEKGLFIQLKKSIPSGAGMGGGSSDAGTVIRFLAEHFFPDKLSACGPFGGQFKARLLKIACSAGADVPYFLYRGLCHLRGIGELVRELPDQALSGSECVIVKPGVSVPTAALFEKFRNETAVTSFGPDRVLSEFASSGAARAGLSEIGNLIHNDLQETVTKLVPEVGNVIRELSRAEGYRACMTGSGSAVFAFPQTNGAKFPESILSSLEERSALVFKAPIISRENQPPAGPE